MSNKTLIRRINAAIYREEAVLEYRDGEVIFKPLAGHDGMHGLSLSRVLTAKELKRLSAHTARRALEDALEFLDGINITHTEQESEERLEHINECERRWRKI